MGAVGPFPSHLAPFWPVWPVPGSTWPKPGKKNLGLVFPVFSPAFSRFGPFEPNSPWVSGVRDGPKTGPK